MVSVVTSQPDASNPFSTHFVRPGVLPFIYPGNVTREDLVTAISKQRAMEISGPHGVGKSTLLHHLLPRLKVEFSRIRWCTVRRSNADTKNRTTEFWSRFNFPRLNSSLKIDRRLFRGDVSKNRSLLILEGSGLLSRIQRTLTLWSCRIAGDTLLATVHRRDFWLPTLVSLNPKVQCFADLVDRLQSGRPSCVTREDAELAFERSRGNMREAFMLLYDRYQEIAIRRDSK